MPFLPPLLRLRWQMLAVCVVTSTVYFLWRTPALDEWDSVQFAQGVTDFNLWQHRPHPPGYPLYELSGWLGSHLLGLDVPTALQLASALGGGLFVACWFALAAQTFGRLVGAGCAVALGTLLITWMTATKVLTDGLGAGLLALTLLLVRNRRLVPAALVGAAVVGVRPQTFPVVALVVGLAGAGESASRRLAGWGAFLGGCLLWLLPTMALQARTPESGGDFLAYPAQLLAQWRWRLDQPKAFIGAQTHGESFLHYRLEHHLLGWLTRGFGFPLASVWGWLGVATLALGGTFYVLQPRRRADADAARRRFWKLHLPWALLYVGIVFCCLPGDQRYYLPIFPLLLLPALVGWANLLPAPRGRFLIAVVPAATGLATLPFVAENHREPAPPVRMLRFLQAQHPPAERPRVCLVLRDSFRHAQWYAPEFRLVFAGEAAVWQPLRADPNSIVYTDDPELLLAPVFRLGDWQRTPTGTWSRSPLIYRKHNAVSLYRWLPQASGSSRP